MLKRFIHALMGLTGIENVTPVETVKPVNNKPMTTEELQAFFASLNKPKGGNKYQPIDGHGPGAAARRVRAMMRTARPRPDCALYDTIHGPRTQVELLATKTEYDRHVANGNVYK